MGLNFSTETMEKIISSSMKLSELKNPNVPTIKKNIDKEVVTIFLDGWKILDLIPNSILEKTRFFYAIQNYDKAESSSKSWNDNANALENWKNEIETIPSIGDALSGKIDILIDQLKNENMTYPATVSLPIEESEKYNEAYEKELQVIKNQLSENEINCNIL